MAKKKAVTAKVSAKAVKKAKAASKVERKEQKNVKKSKGKGKDAEDDDEDLEGILEKMRREWEEAHTVTEELVEGPPSRRANATLTACPGGNHLWCIGGEFFSDDGKAYFYNDVFRYSPEKDEWRKFVSPTCPGPRSAHAVVATPAGGGKVFLFGGEFSSLHQNTFHHYRDFWVFDITTHSWDRIDTKVRPSARSGHRMAVFKHYIVLFGGFYDPGITTRYLNDLWVFDTQEYKWRQIEMRETDPRPSPRSGFSFLASPDGILLHGGYCKEYAKGKRPVGVMLEDTWFLNMSLTTPVSSASTPAAASAASHSRPKAAPSSDTLKVKWERRKRPSYAPPLRSGCTMTLWAAKNTGVLFGGVTDEDRHEETLESVFWNDLYGYQIPGKGRWVSMGLKKPKKKAGGGGRKKKAVIVVQKYHPEEEKSDEDGDGEDEDDDSPMSPAPPLATGKGNKNKVEQESKVVEPEIDPDDPNLTAPLPRYNAMLAVLRNTLYIYGGIYEKGSREYTLDDFYSLQLDKLERYVCLKESGVVIADGEESSSDDDDDDDDDEDEDEDDEEKYWGGEGEDDGGGKGDGGGDGDAEEAEEETLVDPEEEEEEGENVEVERPKVDLRDQATAFMGVAKDATRSPEDVISTPLPGETLAMFYARSREHWSQKAHGASDNRGKQLRRDGFVLAEERYAEYKPILEEVEKILAEAGLDEEEMRRGAAAGPMSPAAGAQSRNRR
ncbi:galactose oxidase [Lyophyllum atratum]|nr:galactose oxidase [Lyophyllum atratum]